MISLRLLGYDNHWSFERGFSFFSESYQRASEENIQILLTPEAALTGYRLDGVGHKEDIFLESAIKKLPLSDTIAITGGMISSENRLSICSYVFSSHYFGKYQKTHLGKKESSFYPGEQLKLFSLGEIPSFFVALCYELHFPRIFHAYGKEKAKIAFVPFSSPLAVEERLEIWNKLAPARAYDNGLFLILLNRGDKKGRCAYGVYNPKGNKIAQGAFPVGTFLDLSLDISTEETSFTDSKNFLQMENETIFQRRPIHETKLP